MGGAGTTDPRGMGYPPSAVLLTPSLSLVVFPAQTAMSAPITCWVGPSGRVLVTLSVLWTITATGGGEGWIKVNSTTAANPQMFQQNPAAAGSATYTTTAVILFSAADGVVPNALNTFTPMGSYVIASAVLAAGNSGSMVVQPL